MFEFLKNHKGKANSAFREANQTGQKQARAGAPSPKEQGSTLVKKDRPKPVLAPKDPSLRNGPDRHSFNQRLSQDRANFKPAVVSDKARQSFNSQSNLDRMSHELKEQVKHNAHNRGNKPSLSR